VRASLQAAVEEHVLPENPAGGIAVKGGTKPSKVGLALSPDEIERFLAPNPDDRLDALWHTALHTGMRPGELLALRWSDWDDVRGLLHVRRALVRVGSEIIFAPCKAESERAVPVGLPLARFLQQHRARQEREIQAYGREAWGDPALIFTSEIGTALDHHNVAKRFRARVKRAGVRPIRFYDLRHSFGTALIAAGVDAKTVAELLGHKDVSMTLRHYTHPDEASRRSAVERLPWQQVQGAPEPKPVVRRPTLSVVDAG
jgi:integrase